MCTETDPQKLGKLRENDTVDRRPALQHCTGVANVMFSLSLLFVYTLYYLSHIMNI